MTRYRICAVGNSHMATAKFGWDAIAREFPDYTFEFFGFPPNSATVFDEHAAVVGRSLVAKTEFLQNGFRLTSGGKTQIDGADYSAYVTFGMGLGSASAIAKTCSEYRLLQHAEPDSYLISRACLLAAIDDEIRSPRALAPFRALQAISDAPIFFQASPAPTGLIVGDPDYSPLSVSGLYGDIARHFAARCSEIGSKFYRYLAQPESTLDERGFTRHEFIADGVGFTAFSTGNVKQKNITHGNKAYGEIMMRQVLRALQEADLTPRAVRGKTLVNRMREALSR